MFLETIGPGKATFHCKLIILLVGSLSIPEVRGSNPVITKFILNIYCIEKTKIKEKRPWKGPFKK